jgi:hypothetical protein
MGRWHREAVTEGQVSWRDPSVTRLRRAPPPHPCGTGRDRNTSLSISGGHHKPGSVSSGGIPCGTGLRWQPFICSPDCSGALAANPGRSGRNTPTHLAMGARPLFGLAPGGVCHAVAVASPPVRSYRTLSPLPVRFASEEAIGGLLSVALSLAPPKERRRALPATLVSWSPDFPRALTGTRLPQAP